MLIIQVHQAQRAGLARCVSLVLLYLMAAGCVPMHYPDNPAVAGQVTDARGGKPVSGAVIKLTRSPDDRTLTTTTSNASGGFAIAAKRHLGLLALGGDIFLPRLNVTASASGYLPAAAAVDPWRAWTGTLALEPAPAVP